MGNLVTIALVAVALFVVFWTLRSTPAQGQKVLQRWGIAKPTEEQGRIAADYLLQRRKIYPYVALVVFGLAILGQWLLSTGDGARWEGVLLFSVVGSLLVAELIATMRRPSDQTRAATLTPRRFTDVVPRFGLVALGFLGLLIVGYTVVTIAALPFAKAANAWREIHGAELKKLDDWEFLAIDTSMGAVWFALLVFVVCVAASLGVVRLCQVRGPLTTDLAVDAALRIRSGRVALGTAVLLGVGLVGAADGTWHDLALTADAAGRLPDQLAGGFPQVPEWIATADRLVDWTNVAGFLFLFVWVLLINPWRTQRLVAANA